MEGAPSLLGHPGAVGSGRGFSALRMSSSAVARRNRAGSFIPRLLLFNVVAKSRVPNPTCGTTGGG